MPINIEQKRIVHSTAPILKEYGKEITSIFYKHLFQAHPELLNLFNQTNQKLGSQPLALANIIYFAAENIDHLDKINSEINIIAHKHRALTVQPEHYPMVGKFMLKAIAEYLGNRATTDILDAWAAAYGVIANTFIEIEKKLYQDLGNVEENEGFIPFTIVKKEKIAEGPIYAIELRHADGKKLIDYQSGQFITLRLKKNDQYHNRHYGLVGLFDGKSYRIAMKIENDRYPKGIFTNEFVRHYHVGSEVFGSLPAGVFTIIQDAEKHLFIAGGVGITVLLTMIEDLCLQNKSDFVTVIHCLASRAHAAYTERVKMMVPYDQFHLLYHDKTQVYRLLDQIITPKTHVYLCAATSLIKSVENHLEKRNFPSSNIHMNTFRPRLSIMKNSVRDYSTTKSL